MKRQSVERRQSANAEEAVCVNDVLDSKEKRKSWGVCVLLRGREGGQRDCPP